MTSAITLPQRGAVVPAGESLEVSGYAYSGGGRGIVRVDVSADGGQTWQSAALGEGVDQPLDRAWAWTFWSTEFDIDVGGEVGRPLEIISKATDAAHNTQPDSVLGVWNLRGINNNAWSRQSVTVGPPEEEEDHEDDRAEHFLRAAEVAKAAARVAIETASVGRPYV